LAPTITQLWTDTHAERHSWAKRGYNQFLDGLSKWTRPCFASTELAHEVSVVLFGRSQAGKTTLLLQLLGIAGENMAHVSTLLRGGRTAGQSATATAMRYQRWSGESWLLSYDGRERELDDDDLRDELAAIRRQVEAGRAGVEPAVVCIPERFFSHDKVGLPPVRILDLPGDNPQNPSDAAHVRSIASSYIPYADLVLIIGRADGLDFLNPSAFVLPGIRDWRYTPTRFRIITSFSFSPKTLVEWIKCQETPSIEAVRDRPLKQNRPYPGNQST
jgi:hypothetical protein